MDAQKEMAAIRADWMASLVGRRVVVRDHMAGVYCGTLAWVDGAAWALTEARQAHYWTGAAATPGLAVRGPTGGRIGPACDIAGESLVSIMPCTDAAAAAWDAQQEWRP